VFAGLVQAVGQLVEVVPRPESTRIVVASNLPGRSVAGESISVDGVCLTVARVDGDRFHADVIAETAARTTLGQARAGRRVNLERALRLGDRLGGHLIQGHVDGTAAVVDVTRRGDDWRVRVELDDALRRFVARKGSIAVQGVSLTVAAVAREWFEVALIPETVARTTLGQLVPGERVNVEVDLVARYLDSLLRERMESESR
jgi:riboflavin synthase